MNKLFRSHGVTALTVAFILSGASLADPVSISSSLAVASTKANAGFPQIQIDKFRFGRKKKSDSERLVIEFKPKERGTKLTEKPELKLLPHPNGKEMALHISGLSLVGAIPEASINDSFVSKSRYLGPISIATDDPSAPLTMRLFYKFPGAAVDAFWLVSPIRLVVDVAKDAASLSRNDEDAPQKVAVVSPKEASRLDRAPASKPPEGKSVETVICFPAASRLKAGIGFVSKTKPGKKEAAQDEGKQADAEEGLEDIACYPLAAQMIPTVNYQARSEADESNVATGPGVQPVVTGAFPQSPQAAPPGFQGYQYAIPNSPLMPMSPNSAGAMQGGGLLNLGGHPSGLGQPLLSPGRAPVQRAPTSNFGQPYASPGAAAWPPGQQRAPANPGLLLPPTQ